MTEKHTPRCDAERYESGPTAANYGINDPDIVVDYTFAQQLEIELAAMQVQLDANEKVIEANNKMIERLQTIIKDLEAHQ